MVGAYYARKNWKSLAPDLVFVLNDLWYLTHYSSEFGMLESRWSRWWDTSLWMAELITTLSLVI